MPEILVLQLKRFTGKKEKVNSFVRIPEIIDVPGYATRAKYQLFGTVHHVGGLEFGHYVTDCLDGYSFDDSRVSKGIPW